MFFTKSSLGNENLPGEHNARNIAAAVAAIDAALHHKNSPIKNINPDTIQKAIMTFKPPEGRLENLGIFEGIQYINDTAATTPDAVCAAIRSFPKEKTILLAGGENKGLQYKELAEEISKGIKFLVLLEGSASVRLINELKTLGWNKFSAGFNDMESAVSEARKNAQKNDIIILSPGAASFNLFKHEFDRGEQFKQSIGRLA